MHKQVIIVRSDIEMSVGKMIAQCCHASLSSALESKKTLLKAWEKEGQKKVVLSADIDMMMKIRNMCIKSKIPHALVADAGHTELKSGTITALAVGPDTEKRINKITGSLPLMK